MVEWSRALVDPASILVTSKIIFSFFCFFLDFFLVLSLSGACDLFSLVCFSEFDLQRLGPRTHFFTRRHLGFLRSLLTHAVCARVS